MKKTQKVNKKKRSARLRRKALRKAENRKVAVSLTHLWVLVDEQKAFFDAWKEGRLINDDKKRLYIRYRNPVDKRRKKHDDGRNEVVSGSVS